MTIQSYCSNCGALRLPGARFCSSCGRGYDPADPSAAPVVAAQSNQAATAGGVAWIVCAGFTGYLALLQFQAASQLQSFGLSDQGLMGTAAWNGVAAGFTLYFAARLLIGPTRGILGTSAGWAAISLILGVYQIANGVSHWAFIGSTVAAAAAGVLSLAARNAIAAPINPAGVSPPGAPAPIAPSMPTFWQGGANPAAAAAAAPRSAEPLIQAPAAGPITDASRSIRGPILIVVGLVILAVLAGIVFVNLPKGAPAAVATLTPTVIPAPTSAHATSDACRSAFRGVAGDLTSVRGMTIGSGTIEFGKYETAVKRARASAARVDQSSLDSSCLVLVASIVHDILGNYDAALSTWSKCNAKASCKSSSIDVTLGQNWREASSRIDVLNGYLQ